MKSDDNNGWINVFIILMTGLLIASIFIALVEGVS